ncbi:MAG: ATP-binding protein [Lachnospiraceae bacterium]|nr:ATP-binding protein [Lachnospiraceae bacterium]
MKRKLNSRFIGLSIAVIVLLTISLTFIFYHQMREQVRADLAGALQLIEEGSEVTPRALASRYDSEDHLRITLIDADGTVLFDNWANASKMENHQGREEVKTAEETGRGFSVRDSETRGINSYYYAEKLSNGKVLRVAREAKGIWSLFVDMMPAAIIIGGVAIVISVLLTHALTRQLIKPINEMAKNIDNYTIVPEYRELDPFVHKIRSQHEDILKAAKMRQDFTANVSHELKTPLTAISGYAEIIENGMAGPRETRSFAVEIHKNADRLLKLINDIIQLSQLDQAREGENFQSMDLYESVKKCAETLSVNAEKRKVIFEYDGEPCPITGDPAMIEELIYNLGENAIRYNNPGGYVNIFARHVAGHPVLTVADNGIGIPKDQQDRVFERFYRVDKSRSKATGGTGLGLSIVKHIVELHDARLNLESEPGQGTTISVIF